MSKNSEFFTRIREEEYDDYRQDQLYIEEQKWMEEEEYWNSLKKRAIVEKVEQLKQKENNEEISDEHNTLSFP